MKLCRKCRYYKGFRPIPNIQTIGVCVLEDNHTTPDCGCSEYKKK